MYKIFGQECKFNINKDERTIVAYIEKLSRLYDDVCHPYKQNIDDMFVFFSPWDVYRYYRDLGKAEDKMYAKAVCSKNDEWNEDIGKQIAYVKLYDKVIKTFSRVSELYENDLSKIISNMNNDLFYHFRKVDKFVQANNRNRLKALGVPDEYIG